MNEPVEFKDLKGKILKSIERFESNGDDSLIFVDDDYRVYKMYHDQDYCEDVHIEDICGDLDDIIGEPILFAEESTNKDEDPAGVNTQHYPGDSFTWTFYRIGTIKGDVTIRWYGESNGYYSESVYFEIVE